MAHGAAEAPTEGPPRPLRTPAVFLLWAAGAIRQRQRSPVLPLLAADRCWPAGEPGADA